MKKSKQYNCYPESTLGSNENSFPILIASITQKITQFDKFDQISVGSTWISMKSDDQQCKISKQNPEAYQIPQ